MKKFVKVLFALLAVALLNVAVQHLAFSPVIADLANAHSLGAVHSFVFGDPTSAMVLANTPALLTQFSRNIEQLPQADNSFLNMSVDESMFVNGEKVVRPVAGGYPTVITNPKVFPLQVNQSDDDSHEYAIALHATLPQRIADWQELQQSYPSRQGVLDRHVAALRHKIAREILYNWSPSNSSSIIETTGASKAAGLTAFGATGNRKKFTRDEILDAIQYLKQFDDGENLNMLIPASFTRDIRAITEFVSYDKTGRPDGYSRSSIGMIDGVNVMTRSTGLVYNASKVAQRVAIDEATNRIIVDEAYCQGILVWSADSVFRAIGKMTPYIDPKSGALLGGTVNFSQAAGGNIRKDGLGVVAIVEKTV